jgi:plasmid stabilization system protein ParE
VNGVRVHAAARRELLDASDWYDERTPGAGWRLRAEVRQIGNRITGSPEGGTPYLYGTRRYVLTRFPYSTVYLALDASGYIVAVAHHRRRPGYWRRRLKDV